LLYDWSEGDKNFQEQRQVAYLSVDQSYLSSDIINPSAKSKRPYSNSLRILLKIIQILIKSRGIPYELKTKLKLSGHVRLAGVAGGTSIGLFT